MKFISPSHENSWNAALKALDPSPAELGHGLELHQSLFAADNFCFLPCAAWNDAFADMWNELKARNIGQKELSERMSHVHYDQCCFDPDCAALFRKAMRASGLNCLVHTVGEDKSREDDFKRMADTLQVMRVPPAGRRGVPRRGDR